MLGERRVLEPAPGIERSAARQTRLERIPWVSWAVIVLSVATYLVPVLLGGQQAEEAVVEFGALFGPAMRDGGDWYRVLTTVFVHGGAIHLFFNMSVVWTLGFALERSIRSWRFLLVSLITALGAATFVLWLAPAVPTVGASGMILGWAGAILPIATREGRRTISVWLIQIAVISLLPFVSWQGHLGGFVFGLPCGLLLRNRAKYFSFGAPVLLALSLLAVYVAGIHFVGSPP
ncbi:MAG: rhomboid family intramembrane serine protease [Myxococcaceae bacterium]